MAEVTQEKAEAMDMQMQEAINEAHIPEAVIEEVETEKGRVSAKEPEERSIRIIRDDFDTDNPMNYIHPEDEVRVKWQEIRDAAKRKLIKNCTVLGVAALPRDAGVYVTTKINDFKCIITADEFFLPGTFSDNIENVDQKTKCERQMQMAQRMLGASISVIITRATSHYNAESQERTYSIAASRVAAAEVRKNLFFWNSKGQTVGVGSIVQARLLLVSEGSVLVETCGVQSRVPFPRLSGKYYLNRDNVLDYFPKSMGIPMVVEEMAKNPETREVELRLSHRATEDLNKAVLDESYIGRRFLGRVIAITDTHYISHCDSENVTCSTPIDRVPQEVRLRKNDLVALQVYGIGHNFLKCNCRKI